MAVGSVIWTYFDGQWHDGNPAVMRAADHGMWLGTLVFDGARAFDGVVPDLEAHCQRLNASAHALGLKPVHTVDELTKLTYAGLAHFDKDAAVYIRPMYWSTESGPGVVVADPDSTVFALCLEQLPMAPAEATQTLTTTQFVRPLLSMATVNAKAACLYPNNGRMLREAQSKGFNNALVADALGNVAETATSNIFMAKDGVVYTPAANGTFLNGVTRQRVIGLMESADIAVVQGVLSFADFHRADEVFMTGNITKITPVTRFDDTHYKVGPFAERARELYWTWAKRGNS